MEKPIKYADMSLEQFTSAAASAKPIPGGGGAAALAGALSAALGAMSCALTLEGAAENPALKEALDKLEVTRGYFVRLIDEDARSFKPVEKYIIGKDKNDPQRVEKVMYTGTRTLELLAAVADSAAPVSASEIGCAVELCLAAMRAARLTIMANASHMADDVFARTLRRECEMVFEQFEPVAKQTLDKVMGKIM